MFTKSYGNVYVNRRTFKQKRDAFLHPFFKNMISSLLNDQFFCGVINAYKVNTGCNT